jgi:uncharacterized protein (TIGR00369 family)
MAGRIDKTYGTISAERQREMSGLEFVQGLVDGALPLNTIADTLGYDVAEVEHGRVVVTLEPNGAHLNPYGTIHGGLTATLLDSCMGLAVQSTLEKGVGQTTVEFKISLVRPITLDTGTIRAEGLVLSRGRRVGTAEGRVTDANGRLLAHGTTTCLIFRPDFRRPSSRGRRKRSFAARFLVGGVLSEEGRENRGAVSVGTPDRIAAPPLADGQPTHI